MGAAPGSRAARSAEPSPQLLWLQLCFVLSAQEGACLLFCLVPGKAAGATPAGGGGFHRWPRPNLSLSCRTLAATFFSSFGGAVSSRKLRSRLSSGTKSPTFWTFPGASAAGAGSGDGRHQLLPGVPRPGPQGRPSSRTVCDGAAGLPAQEEGDPPGSARVLGNSKTTCPPTWDACAHIPQAAAPRAYLEVRGPPQQPARSRTVSR